MKCKLLRMTVGFTMLMVVSFGALASAQQNTFIASNKDFNLTANWGQLDHYTVINGVVENKRKAPVKIAFKPHLFDANGNELALPNDQFFGIDSAGPNYLVLPGDKGYFSYAVETAELSGQIAKISFELVNPEEFTDNFQFQLTDVTTKVENEATRVAGAFANTGDTCSMPNIAVVAYKGNAVLVVYQAAISIAGGSATELAAGQADKFNFSANVAAKSLQALGATKIDVVGGCSSVNTGNAFSSGALTASAAPQPVKQPEQPAKEPAKEPVKEPAKQPAPPSKKPAGATGGERSKVTTSTADLTWNCYGWYNELCEGSDPEVQTKCLEALKKENPFFMVSCEIRNNTAKTLAPAFLIHYYDANGNDLVEGGQPVRPGDRILLPNGTVYMLEMRQLAEPDKIKKLAVDFKKASTLKEIQAQVETANVNVTYDDFGATVSGTLKNTGSSACFTPSVQVVSYRGESLLYVEDVYLDKTQELAAGESVEFSVQASAPAALESFKQAGVTDVKVISACGIQY